MDETDLSQIDQAKQLYEQLLPYEKSNATSTLRSSNPECLRRLLGISSLIVAKIARRITAEVSPAELAEHNSATAAIETTYLDDPSIHANKTAKLGSVWVSVRKMVYDVTGTPLSWGFAGYAGS